ncbi:MAG: beta strand repeat-containing protein [Thermoguttaceae bacterium]|jgi:uncharacterized repeat protein (TIGR01451 family)
MLTVEPLEQRQLLAVAIPSGSISPYVWDPVHLGYESGNPSGYRESDTVAAVAVLNPTAAGPFTVDLTLQVTDGKAPSYNYAFTSFDTWCSTFSRWDSSATDGLAAPNYLPPTTPEHGPMVVPSTVNGNGVPLSDEDVIAAFEAKGWDTKATVNGTGSEVPVQVWGYNVDVIDVSPDPAQMGWGAADANYLSTTVTFELHDENDDGLADGPGYIAFGGVLAAPFSALPPNIPGTTDTQVPVGQSVSFINGTFQARIAGAGDKTINFKGDDIIPLPQLLVTKDATGTWGDNSFPMADDKVEYAYTVSNNGNVPLFDVTLKDDNGTQSDANDDLTVTLNGLTDVDGDEYFDDLAVGATATGILTYELTQADIDAGFVYNIATAAAFTSKRDSITGWDDATVELPQNASLTIAKDADKEAVTAAGQVINYAITVDNTGNIDLTGVILTDEFADEVTLTGGDNGDGILGVDETWTYTAAYTVTQADMNAGTALLNTAVVDTDQTEPQQDDATTTIDQSPGLTIAKDADKEAVTAAGQVINYAITVDNTGNIDLTGVILTDEFADEVTLTGGDNGDGILGVDETWTYTAAYTVTQADMNAGTALLNTAVVDTDQTEPQQDDATTTIDQSPGLTIAKDADKEAVTAAGQVINYAITVDNTGNIDLTGVILTDEFADEVTLTGGDNGDGILGVDETWTYTAAYTVTQADMNAGTALLNTAVVDTDQTEPQQDDATTTIDQSPGLTIAKDADKEAVTAAGQVINYAITVDNTGNIDLTGVILTDEFADEVTLTGGDNGDGILGVDETWTYTAAYTVTQADMNAGTALLNTAVVDTDQTEPQQDDATTTIDQSPGLTIAKDADKEAVTAAGQVINYAITVDNTGNIDLTGVILTDEFADEVTLTGGDNGDGILGVDETWTYTAAYTVTQADMNAGTALLNTAVVDTDQTEPQQDDATTTIDQSPGLTIAKDADKEAMTAAGQVINYAITVDNTGNIDLTGVILTDEFADEVTLTGGDNGDGILGVDETWTYTAAYTVTQADMNAGTALLNTAVVDTDQTEPQQDDATTTIDQSPGLTIAKDADKEAVTAAGQVINYAITVDNTGNIDLTGVILTDEFADEVTLTGGDNGDGILGVDETWTYTAAYTVTQADMNAGTALLNTAVVDTDQTEPQQDDATTTIDQSPGLTIAKDADKEAVTAAGQVINYAITVDNTGNIDLTGVILTDEFADEVTLTGGDNGDGILGVDETWTYTAAYTVTQADMNAGTALLNTAVVDTDQTEPQQDDATTTIDQSPGLTIAKDADKEAVTAAGQVINYAITVDNTGNIDLTGVILTDEFADEVTLTGGDNGDGILGVDETWTYTAAYTVTQADMNAGTALLNTAVVDTDQTEPQQDDATTTIDQSPGLTIAKDADKEAVTAAGQVINYAITVDNTGNIDLTGVILTDEFADEVTLTGGDNGDGILGVDETWTYTAAYTVTQADMNAGTALLNTAVVDTDQTEPQQDDATTTIDQSPGLTIAKDADKEAVTAAGQVINYAITVDNTGNIDLTGVILTDEFADEVTLTGGDNGDGILGVDETWTYTAAYTVTQADMNAGTALLNTAVVDTDQTEPQQDDATTTIDQSPGLTIAKDADKEAVTAAGQVINYAITVDNTGNIDLTGVVLTDEFADEVTLTGGDSDNDGELDVTETWTYTAAYTVTQADMNAGTALLNTAVVDTDQTEPQQDDATTTIDQSPGLTIAKDADKEAVTAAGQVINYTIKVENTGNIDLTTVVLTDEFADDGATLTDGDNGDGILGVDETWTYTAAYTVTQADMNAGDDLVNVASVDTDQTDPPQQDDATTTITQNPAIDIEKLVSVDGGLKFVDADDPLGPFVNEGSSVIFKFEVTNTGNVTLSNVKVVDTYLGVIKELSSMEPGRIPDTTITVPAVLGQHTNTATAAGSSPNGSEIRDTDKANYWGVSSAGRILPTGATAEQYISGTATAFEDFYPAGGVEYGVKGKVINSANPGVFYYFTGASGVLKTDENGDLFVEIRQTNDLETFPLFVTLQNNVQVFTVNDDGDGTPDAGDTCTALNTGVMISLPDTDSVHITITNPTVAGQFIVISLKYDTSSLVDTLVNSPLPTVHYQFTTYDAKDAPVQTTPGGLTVLPKVKVKPNTATETTTTEATLQAPLGAAANIMTFTGTDDQPDAFVFDAAKPGVVMINGVEKYYDPAAIGALTFVAGDGEAWDTLELIDSSGDDLLEAAPGLISLSTPEVTVVATGFEAMQAYGRGGGLDRVVMAGSDGNDAFKGTPDYARLRGPGYNYRAKFYESMTVDASQGGRDRARLVGSDQPDLFVAMKDQARITSQQRLTTRKFAESVPYDLAVNSFEVVMAQASGADDRAELHDSVLGDVFTAKPNKVLMTNASRKIDLAGGQRGLIKPGDVYEITARGFGNVRAVADQVDEAGLADTAKLYDSEGDDLWYFDLVDGETYSTMSTAQRQLYEAFAFERVGGYGFNGGANTKEHKSTGNQEADLVDLVFQQGMWED